MLLEVFKKLRSLGDLIVLKIWHDNSGKGEFGGWYVNDISILDIQTGVQSLFSCNTWLAVEFGDGNVEKYKFF